MNTNGKRARANSGMNRHEIKREMRAKRHDKLSCEHDSKIGSNARKAAKRSAAK